MVTFLLSLFASHTTMHWKLQLKVYSYLPTHALRCAFSSSFARPVRNCFFHKMHLIHKSQMCVQLIASCLKNQVLMQY